MTTTDTRTDRLVANRRAAAAQKQAHTLATLDRMLSNGERVTFVEVQRMAGVSTWFVYNNPIIRHAIESAIRDQRNRQAADLATPSDDRTPPGLRAELANARAEIRDLRDERDRLRRRLQRDLGDQVDALGKRGPGTAARPRAGDHATSGRTPYSNHGAGHRQAGTRHGSR